VVRDTKTLHELIESIRGISMSPEQLRVARADADFERIFGSE
jgi:hypothetical protein